MRLWGPWSKGKAAGLIPNADAGSSPAGSTRRRCHHERAGYLRGIQKVLAGVYFPLSLLGVIAFATSAHWALTAAIYALLTASIALSLVVNRKQDQHLDQEELRLKADLAEILTEQRAIPIERVMAVRDDPRAPAEIRAEARAEIARRRGGLN